MQLAGQFAQLLHRLLPSQGHGGTKLDHLLVPGGQLLFKSVLCLAARLPLFEQGVPLPQHPVVADEQAAVFLIQLGQLLVEEAAACVRPFLDQADVLRREDHGVQQAHHVGKAGAGFTVHPPAPLLAPVGRGGEVDAAAVLPRDLAGQEKVILAPADQLRVGRPPEGGGDAQIAHGFQQVGLALSVPAVQQVHLLVPVELGGIVIAEIIQLEIVDLHMPVLVIECR